MIVGYVSVFECRLACAEYINMLMFDERYPTVMPDFGCLLLMVGYIHLSLQTTTTEAMNFICAQEQRQW